jgi:hypothetical protein
LKHYIICEVFHNKRIIDLINIVSENELQAALDEAAKNATGEIRYIEVTLEDEMPIIKIDELKEISDYERIYR